MEATQDPNQFVSNTSAGDSYSKGWTLIFTTFVELLVITLVHFSLTTIVSFD